MFNDDKKTDLIGEAWIDLTEVIVPGGGQSDQWRQLNFKGKYAGDIRVELTYYDTRPKPEASPERKKQREKAHSTASEAQSSASSSRQLGPREIRRRPLPPGPGGYSSPASVTHTPERFPSEEPPDMWANNAYSNANPPPRPPKQKFVPETPDDVGYDLNPRFGPDSYAPPYPHRPSSSQRQVNDFNDGYEQTNAQYDEPDPFTMDMYQPRPLPSHPTTDSKRSSVGNTAAAQQSPHSPPIQSPFNSSPPIRTPPQLSSSLPGQNQGWQGRLSTSPTKYAAYRDSPLRQSMTQPDAVQGGTNYFDPRFDEDSPPPPPPPVHRGQVQRNSVVASSPHQILHGHPEPRSPVKYSSVEQKSPLQRLEREGRTGRSPHSQPQAPPMQAYDMNSAADHDRYPMFPTSRRRSFNDNMPPLRPSASANDVPTQFQDPRMMQPRFEETPQLDFRHSVGPGPPRRAQTFESFEIPDERQVRRSDPVVLRPRAISPNPRHSIPRKSVTSPPATPEDRPQMAGAPFSPDSYDVLNPGTSPSDYSRTTPGDTSELARQREVDKMRDLGPIIGNDGRVIDPSDHLPSDTWAPEPERKTRKPEHVIKIRTKEEARVQQNRTGSSPTSAGPHSMSTSPYPSSPGSNMQFPYQSPPVAAPAPMAPSPQQESPTRNRLKKVMPTRPLPTQPYPHAQTSPAVLMTSPVTDSRPSPSAQRYSLHSSPAGGLPQRPPLSEYHQAPSTTRNSVHGGPVLPPQFEYPHTPTRGPLNGQVHSMNQSGSPYGADDPLALELSTIDIGPSRMGRTALRPQRGYGTY